jgi:hypothetical protein
MLKEAVYIFFSCDDGINKPVLKIEIIPPIYGINQYLICPVPSGKSISIDTNQCMVLTTGDYAPMKVNSGVFLNLAVLKRLSVLFFNPAYKLVRP